MKEKPKNKQKKKYVRQQYTAIIFFMLLGAACGFLIISYMDRVTTTETLDSREILNLVLLFVVMYAGMFLHIIIHEAGHLVFGLLSGYKFSSFRVMSYMWIKENEKIKFKRLTIAGTGGQCLMAPPDLKDGKFPAVLYNLGGSLMNIIAAVFFLILSFITTAFPLLSTVMLLLSTIGFAIAAMNGIPMRMGMVDNDGYNAFALTRNRDALRAFWVQLKANEQFAKGARIKELPEEWFSIPSDTAMKNSMVAVLGVFACNRLTDMHKFEEADKLMEHLLTIDSGIVDLHRSLLVCDRIFIELITKKRSDMLDNLLTKEQKKFMKSMKTFPSVLRTEYTYALLSEKDTKKAEAIKTQFEKIAKKYPYPNDIISERELMDIAKNTADIE